MPSTNTPGQPDQSGQPHQAEGIDPADAAAPTQQLHADAEAPTQQLPADAAAPSQETPAPETAGPQPPVAAPTAPRNRFAWVSSPRVAAATVISVLALGALGGAFALGRATAGHDHGERGIMVEMGVPGGPGFGGPGFDGRGFGRERFGGQVPMPCQACQVQPEDGQKGQQDDQVSPAPSGSANG